MPISTLNRLAVGLVASIATLGAAEIHLTNGSIINGDVIERQDDRVVIDAKLGGQRARVTLRSAEIAEIKGPDVDPSLFAAPTADPKSEGSKAGSGSYLAVPLKGIIGTDLYADAVQKILVYANRWNIPHVVFDIDIDSGSDLDETTKMIKAINQYKRNTKIHAVVSRCMGTGIGLLVLSDTLAIREGGRIGGLSPQPLEGMSQEDLDVFIRDLARRVGHFADSKGQPGEVYAAMIDPSMELAIWVDDEGKPAGGLAYPEGIAEEKKIAATTKGSTLLLTSKGLNTAGVPIITGGMAALGEILEIEDWREESDYGLKTISSVAESKRRSTASKEARTERELERLKSRHTRAMESYEHNLNQAKEWDPNSDKNKDYATYKGGSYRYHGWGWRGQGYSSYSDSKRFTYDSRKRWTQRTNVSASYLAEAIRSLNTVQRLDRDMVRKGMEPAFGEDEIKRILRDLDVHRKALIANKDRKEQ